jgi:dsDNA-specific endonuclease/ATPase MutS2
MATEDVTPVETETPPSVVPDVPTVPTPPVVEGGVEVYNSSEEFQMAHARGIAQQKADEAKRQATTEKEKIHEVLDNYIGQYSKTTEVRKLAAKHKKSAEHYLDVAADVVEILEKIKNQLRK